MESYDWKKNVISDPHPPFLLFMLISFFFYLTNKEMAMDECVITFLDNLICSGFHSLKT